MALRSRTWTCMMFWRAGYRPRDAMGPCGCCDSCHDDANAGLSDLLEGRFKGRDYSVCCRMKEALEYAAATLPVVRPA